MPRYYRRHARNPSQHIGGNNRCTRAVSNLACEKPLPRDHQSPIHCTYFTYDGSDLTYDGSKFTYDGPKFAYYGSKFTYDDQTFACLFFFLFFSEEVKCQCSFQVCLVRNRFRSTPSGFAGKGAAALGDPGGSKSPSPGSEPPPRVAVAGEGVKGGSVHCVAECAGRYNEI